MTLVTLFALSVLFYLKPESETNIITSNTLLSSEFYSDESHLSANKENLVEEVKNSESTQSIASDISTKNIVFDTKSDFSIQPIDPDTDPANQIIEPN